MTINETTVIHDTKQRERIIDDYKTGFLNGDIRAGYRIGCDASEETLRVFRELKKEMNLSIIVYKTGQFTVKLKDYVYGEASRI